MIQYVIFGINTNCDISKLSQILLAYLTARKITYNNFKISLMVFMPNITTNHAITYTNLIIILFPPKTVKLKVKMQNPTAPAPLLLI